MTCQHQTCQHQTRQHQTKRSHALSRGLLLCAALVPTLASAAEADARRLLKAMSDYLAAQKAIPSNSIPVSTSSVPSSRR